MKVVETYFVLEPVTISQVVRGDFEEIESNKVTFDAIRKVYQLEHNVFIIERPPEGLAQITFDEFMKMSHDFKDKIQVK